MFEVKYDPLKRISGFLIAMLISFSSLGFGVIPALNYPCEAQAIPDVFFFTDLDQGRKNFTIDSYRDFNDFSEVLENVTLMDAGAGDGRLRLSTGLPDITITSSYTTSEPVYAETLVMEPGAVWRPDGNGDSVEIYVRNFIMNRGGLIDVSGRGGNQLGEGEDGNDAQNAWTGGGGGGGGGYGMQGGDGGRGGANGGTGGDGGDEVGDSESYAIETGGKGGDGGDGSGSGGNGGDGGGTITLVAENIFINDTIICRGSNGVSSENANEGTGGGGGGGAGGGILLSGKRIEYGNFGKLLVGGGDGGDSGDTGTAWRGSGGTGAGGAGGRIKVFHEEDLINSDNLTTDILGGIPGTPGESSQAARIGLVGERGGNGTYTTQVDDFELPLDHISPGILISKPFDTANPSPHYDNISFGAETPDGTSVEVYTQTANSSDMAPDTPGDWTDWKGPYTSQDAKIISPDYRWIRIKVILKNTILSLKRTPLFDWINVEYHVDESPLNLNLDVVPPTINTAYGESANITVDFHDSDRYLPGVFSGMIKLRERTSSEELVLLNGTFVEDENCEMENAGEQYRVIYTFTPEKYKTDGTWDIFVELYDGVTERRVIHYNDTQKNLVVFTNSPPVLDPASLSISESVLSIPGAYNATISFDLTDEDPFPVEEFLLSMELKMINGSGDHILVKQRTMRTVDALDLTKTRDSYRLQYYLQVNGTFEEGIYGINIEVKDTNTFGEVRKITYNETDIRLDLKMNSPPASPPWILPRETAENNPRIVWGRATDKDNDPLTYHIQIGTRPLGRDVLVRTSTGVTMFYDLTLALPNDDYYIQVWARDNYFFSPMVQEKMSIGDGFNTPPRPPTMIMPNFTKEIFPVIRWDGAYDMNGDNLTYSIQIGETPGGGEIVKKISVGENNSYQVGEPLVRGEEYYVQVWSFDGKTESYPREEILNVLTKGNHRPEPPTAIFPDITGDLRPEIFWVGGSDLDEDELEYFIQIGSEQGGENILPWTSTGTATTFKVPYNLTYDQYYVQVKCSDSMLESMILEEMLYIWATGNIPPTAPTGLGPTISVKNYPDIWWEGATDKNEDDVGRLFYYIQIGAQSHGNEILVWQISLNPYYNVTRQLLDGVYFVQVMTCDGKVNSSVFQQKMYVGTFKPSVRFSIQELELEKGRNYEVTLNVSNQGSIPDVIRLIFSDIEGIEISTGTIDVNMNNIELDDGEYMEIVLDIAVSKSFSHDAATINVTAISIGGTSTTTRLTIVKPAESAESPIEKLVKNKLFLPLAVIIVMFIIVVVVLIVIKRRNRDKAERSAVFTETVDKKGTPTPIRKKSGTITRISETPIMDPRAKRIAMAIYSAQQGQLNAPNKPDRLRLASGTEGPKIFVPDVAVGTSSSKGAQAIKALPMASVVKDIDQRASVQKDISGLGQMPLTPEQKFSPSVMMPSEVTMGSPAAQDRMEGFKEAVFGVQVKLATLKQQGLNVSVVEERFKTANQYFAEKNTAALGVSLSEIDAMIKELENKKAAEAPGMDFDIKAPVEPPVRPQAPAPTPPSQTPSPSGIPTPPSEPELPAPPPEEKKDVFSDLQNLIEGMK